MKHKKQHYLLTEQAEQDITDIEAYIAEHNQAAAERLVDRIFKAFELLVEHPDSGHTRTDLTDRDVLFWPVKPRFLVIYTRQDTSVLIIRVLPSDRDIANILLSKV
jgi:plasmid stabilization system protein ParE